MASLRFSTRVAGLSRASAVRLALLLAIVQLAVATVQDDYVWVKNLHGLPRYSRNGPTDVRWDISASTDNEYLQSLVIILAAGIATGSALFLFAIIWSCSRTCCDCCGGSKFNPEDPASSSYLNFILISIVIVSLTGIICASISYSANSDVHSGINDSKDALINTVNTLAYDIDFIVFELGNLDTTRFSTPLPDLNEVKDIADTAVDLTITVRDGINSYEGTRNLVMVLLSVFALVASVSLLISLAVRAEWLFTINTWFSLLVMIVFWVLFAIHMTVGVVIADSCVQLDSGELEDVLNQIPQEDINLVNDFVADVITELNNEIDSKAQNDPERIILVSQRSKVLVINSRFEVYATQQFITDFFLATQEALCGKVVRGAAVLFICEVFVAIFFTFGFFLLALASKHAPREYRKVSSAP